MQIGLLCNENSGAEKNYNEKTVTAIYTLTANLSLIYFIIDFYAVWKATFVFTLIFFRLFDVNRPKKLDSKQLPYFLTRYEYLFERFRDLFYYFDLFGTVNFEKFQ